MAAWWIAEAIPIAATALIPLVVFPLLGIRSIGETSSPYANPLIFLFMGRFLIAVGMQRWNLHRRMALSIVQSVGTCPQRVVIGFIIASAFLSMWVSNTATALMMLPIKLSITDLTWSRLSPDPSSRFHFSIVLVLAIAIGIGQNPFWLAVPAAMAASCALMLPVATLPNAIVYSSNLFTIPQMSCAGFWLNVISILFITVPAYTCLGFIFGVEFGMVPRPLSGAG